MKSVPREDFTYFQDMYRDIQSSPYLRAADDAIPEQGMFAYKYMKDDLLSLAEKDVPLPSMKRILRDSLRGLVALHDKGIVHTDIKANNIMVNWTEENGDIEVHETRIVDMEDAAYVPEDRVIIGRQLGNWMWRSPEAHAASRVHKPSDIFSFGIVCIFAMTKLVIFAVDEETLPEGIDKLSIVLERQLSYFSEDFEDYKGLLQYLGNSPWVDVFTAVASAFGDDCPREPFALWKGLDADFKDVVTQMTHVDPRRRITAHDALAHRWFSDIP